MLQRVGIETRLDQADPAGTLDINRGLQRLTQAFRLLITTGCRRIGNLGRVRTRGDRGLDFCDVGNRGSRQRRNIVAVNRFVQ